MQKEFLLGGMLFAILSATFFASSGVAFAELKPVFQDIGKISISVDAEGNNNTDGGALQVKKPQGATVKKAFLMASSYDQRAIADGDVVLATNPITWSITTTNSISFTPDFFHSTFADVTDIVKPIIDAAPTGISELNVTEKDTDTIDGTVLVVVFNDPTVTTDKSIILVFGAQSPQGDTFFIDFSKPLPVDINQVDMGLGIGFGFQDTTGTDQVSLIDVNDIRLTSSAGGEDDGASFDGALITVGGIGDTNDNPDPSDPSSGFRTDDELYNLLPFINTGDKQIKVFSTNPSDDDNIFFSYFELSEPAALLPTIDPPGEKSVIGDLDPNKPTIVITHGLEPGNYAEVSADGKFDELFSGFSSTPGGEGAGYLIKKQLGDSVNVIQFVWPDAFQGALKGYGEARSYSDDAGIALGKFLKENLGTSYNQPVHFIGHSLGTVVSANAAKLFLGIAKNVPMAQITLLDYPNRAPFNPIPDTYFATLLGDMQKTRELKIDNYYTKSGISFGNVAQGFVYNHRRLDQPSEDVGGTILTNEGETFEHAGVHQWYRWTMAPNDFNDTTYCNNDGTFNDPGFFFDNSLDPCNKGWYWSLFGEKEWYAEHPKEGGWEKFPENNGKAVKVTGKENLSLGDSHSFGNCTYSSNVVICQENSSPFIVFDATIPSGAEYLSFDYRFPNVGDGDYVAILLDDVPLWILAASSAFNPSEFTNSGPVPLPQDLSYGQHRLTVALYGVGEHNASFEVKNFQTSSTEVGTAAATTSLDTQLAITILEYGGEDILGVVTALAGDNAAPLLLSELKTSQVDLEDLSSNSPLASGQKKKLKIKFKFLETAGNEYQHTNANVKFTFTAHQ